MIKFKKSKMPIIWHKKEKEVDAYVHNNLMVHKIISDDAKLLWTISHVATGLCIGAMFPPFRIMREAKEMVEKLVKDDDWYIPTARLNNVVAMDDDRFNVLFGIMCKAYEKFTGISYEDCRVVYTEAIHKEPLPQSKCVQCGKDSERLILSKHEDKWGWYNWCFKCMPHGKGIEKEEGKLTRW